LQACKHWLIPRSLLATSGQLCLQTSVPRLYLSPPHLNGHELQFVQEAFASNYIAPLGPMVDARQSSKARA
jgi:hypothetical protein